MEIKKRRIELNEFNLYVITDVHLGSENCNEKGLREMVSTIKKDKKGYWIGLGDFTENITLTDPRFSPGELSTKYKFKDLADLPRKQMKAFYQIIKPISDKCIGLNIGNHEEKYIKHGHFDVYDYLADDLMGQPDLKLGQNGYTVVSMGTNTKRNLKIYSTHGTGLSSSPNDGTVLNSMFQLCDDKIADIYLGGHVHRLIKNKKVFIDVDKNFNLVKTTKVYCVCGAWLDKYHLNTSSYFESSKASETVPGYIKINISITNHKHKLNITPYEIYI